MSGTPIMIVAMAKKMRRTHVIKSVPLQPVVSESPASASTKQESSMKERVFNSPRSNFDATSPGITENMFLKIPLKGTLGRLCPSGKAPFGLRKGLSSKGSSSRVRLDDGDSASDLQASCKAPDELRSNVAGLACDAAAAGLK